MTVLLFSSLVLFLLLVAPAKSQQFTPKQANWATFATKPFTTPINTAHDPNSIGWISAATWNAAKWDGTVYNPSKMTKAAFFSAICPTVDTIRGIREVFYKHKPFANNKSPTKAEVDEWHRIAINHVRALVGYTSADRLVQKDICMFARALWGDQRKFTTMWDAKYPGKVGSAFGPCQGSSNGHCGSTFIPSAADQAPYLPAGHPPCTATAGAEGVFSASKSDIPWSIKWSRTLCNTLMAEGFWGGHVGPFFHRQKFGFSFWDANLADSNSNAVVRGKWTGNLMPSLYNNPAAAVAEGDNAEVDTATDTQNAQSNSVAIIVGCVAAGFAVLLVVIIVVVVITRGKGVGERV